MKPPQSKFHKAISDDKSLAIFLRAMSKFEQFFCDAMAAGEEFTLKLEVHGNQQELIHCRVLTDGFERPPGVERRVQESQRKAGR